MKIYTEKLAFELAKALLQNDKDIRDILQSNIGADIDALNEITDEIFDKIGNININSIGDGTLTGAVDALKKVIQTSINNVEKKLDIAVNNANDAIEKSQEVIADIDKKADTALNIAKGKNQAHVFLTTEDMLSWMSQSENKGLYSKGDNIYIVEIDVPDWWIAEVLDEVDEKTGCYYKIAQLETQKVDLTEIYNSIAEINAAFPFRIEIDDEAGTINLIDR